MMLWSRDLSPTRAATLAALTAPIRESASESGAMFVYVIAQQGQRLIKIGIAKDVEARLHTLQTSNSSKLTIEYRMKCKDEQCARTLEKLLHSKYKPFRQSGEWFAIYPVDVICDISFSVNVANCLLQTIFPVENITEKHEVVRYIKPALLTIAVAWLKIQWRYIVQKQLSTKQKESPRLLGVVKWIKENDSELNMSVRKIQYQLLQIGQKVSVGTIQNARSYIKNKKENEK